MMGTCSALSAPCRLNASLIQMTVVIRDGFPISPGHTLIIRHVGSFFELQLDQPNL